MYLFSSSLLNDKFSNNDDDGFNMLSTSCHLASELRLDAMVFRFGQGICHNTKQMIHQNAGLGIGKWDESG